MKDKLLEVTRSHFASLTEFQKRVGRYSGARIQAGSLLSDAQGVATSWFDKVRPLLESASLAAGMIAQGTDIFDRMLREAKKPKPMKGAVTPIISEGVEFYRDLIHQIETGSFSTTTGLNIAPYIGGLSSDEGEYLDEAQRCLNVNALRGCIVLGWCATIARIQAKLAEIGYDKFSDATVSMAGKTTGRFKFYKNKHSVASLSELQRVFDTDLLWVLEFLELIDGNQHERLRYCFEFRNNSAHPGLAPISGENLYSFYSDISKFILKNPKFALAS
ncbi:hypothetical protein FJN17_26825 [Bradyrhizobium symbiodeficiens]|uniref:RiboL-PSP-HEPN domain-containing protein n=1 Tax=Bradyrhizobium symbiodeficiens TaxID=1404367 RepID=A0ABX5WDG5_9BRAD|nr:hypothetical protein [Bradyrhizobium symbiodeficiens]QDF40892.1 hypothetical protein FJN17_26825 [Bradyrhizobium symbiodeficiens]